MCELCLRAVFLPASISIDSASFGSGDCVQFETRWVRHSCNLRVTVIGDNAVHKANAPPPDSPARAFERTSRNPGREIYVSLLPTAARV